MERIFSFNSLCLLNDEIINYTYLISHFSHKTGNCQLLYASSESDITRGMDNTANNYYGQNMNLTLVLSTD